MEILLKSIIRVLTLYRYIYIYVFGSEILMSIQRDRYPLTIASVRTASDSDRVDS